MWQAVGGLRTGYLRRISGFSIVELILALTLFFILSNSAFLYLKDVIARNILRNEGRHLKLVLEELSLRASQTEKKISLILYDNAYFIQEETVRAGPAEVAALDSHRLRQPIKIAAGAELPLQLNFHKTGVTTPITIRLVNNHLSCLVTLALRGRVNLAC